MNLIIQGGAKQAIRLARSLDNSNYYHEIRYRYHPLGGYHLIDRYSYEDGFVATIQENEIFQGHKP